MPDPSQIITQRLILEPFTEKFLTERYVSWLNDPEVVKYSENRHRMHTIQSCAEYLASFAGSPHCFWAICQRSDMLHIGNVNAYVDEFNSVADMGILIGEPSSSGKGYATEAWRAVMDYLIQHRKIRKISAGAMAANIPMIKVMERCGMQPDGTRKNHFLLNSNPVDLVHMASEGY